MSRYLALFVAEATEHLQALSGDLVALERERTPDAVDSLFRHAHSLKGMAASMGLEAIATLAHRVEDLVEALRSQTGALDQPLVDLLLEATDTMQAQVRAAGSEETLRGAHRPTFPPYRGGQDAHRKDARSDTDCAQRRAGRAAFALGHG